MKPVIIDTDFGGDPDDILALVYSLFSKNLTINAITTSDEYKQNRRANVLKQWIKTQQEIPVFYGTDLGNTNYFLLEKYYSSSEQVEHFSSPAFLKILEKTASENGYYIAIGGLTNLAWLYAKYPKLVSKLSIYIMGGAYKYFQKNVAEHNIRMDISSSKAIFTSPLNTRWLFADYSIDDRLLISLKHTLYKTVSKQTSFFHTLIAENMKQFYENRFDVSYLHDPLLISTLLSDTITFKKEKLSMGTNGVIRHSKQGNDIEVSSGVEYEAFLKDFQEKIALSLR